MHNSIFCTPRGAMSRSRRFAFCAGGLFAAAALMLGPLALSSQASVLLPPPTLDVPVQPGVHSATAVLAGGCFWGVQGVFQHVRGVTQVVSGYAGGERSSASYERVGRGDTGHAESVQISFDPAQVSYGRLLQIYFSVAHNPTQLNYQGPDHGTQYRSAIFPRNAEQQRVAQAYVAQLSKAKLFAAPIVTRIEPFSGFYAAEAYHQNFLVLHPRHPYIVFNDLPKLEQLKQRFPDLYRDKPVFVQVAAAR